LDGPGYTEVVLMSGQGRYKDETFVLTRVDLMLIKPKGYGAGAADITLVPEESERPTEALVLGPVRADPSYTTRVALSM